MTKSSAPAFIARSASVGVAESGQDDHADGQLLGAHLRQQLEPAQVGHAQVGDHQVVFLGSEAIPGRSAVAGRVDLEVVGFEDLAEMMAVELHVVDDEDSASHAALPSL